MADKNPDNERLDEVTGEPLSDEQIIARRTTDIEADSASEHLKVFVIGPVGEKPTETNYDHEPNKAATRQYAISQGMRPLGDVVLKSVEKHKGTKDVWDLTYTLKVGVLEDVAVPSGPDIVSDGPTKNTGKKSGKAAK